jgi:carboxypeptidase T
MKSIKALVTGLFIMVLAGASFGQTYSRVSIQVSNAEELNKLNALPIAADHGVWVKGHFETDLNSGEIQKVKDAGLTCDILIADVSAYYANRNNTKSKAPHGGNSTQATGCGGPIDVPVPTEFELGGMGGFFTYDEFIGHLDNMAALYPNLITVKAPIGNYQTAGGRPIYWVKLSDNVNQSESTEPQVLYTAIHHAREPLGLSQLIFYMYFLLENYATNPDVQDVVNNNELFFVPVINPDGYVYNQTQNPNGGGMWRKNRRNNGDGTFGVDLNRNYSYEWGGEGASTVTSAETYRGTGPFSEPETQAMRFFIEEHTFVTALNYHTYSDLLLYPWGYTDMLQCEDHDAFIAISADMVRRNTLANIQSSALYPAAGDSDDWAYGDVTNKPKVWAMTPELGTQDDGFWPAIDRIIPECKEQVDMNLKLALVAGNYGVLSDQTPIILGANTTGHFKYSLQRLGIADGNFTVTITPLNNILSVGAAQVQSGLTLGETAVDSIAYTLPANLLDGAQVRFVLEVNNGLYSKYDTITKLYGAGTIAFQNTGAPLSDWTISNGWGLSTTTFFSAPNSLADSPNGNYNSNTSRTMRSTQKVDLTDATQAYLRFKAKWDIEAAYDYAQVAASPDGQSWTPLCGKYTHDGTINQDFEQPIYDGTKDGWVDEQIDLSMFAGQQVYIRFGLYSDQGVNGDGIYIDDVIVDKIQAEPQAVNEFAVDKISLYPNPATNKLFLNSTVTLNYTIYNITGQEVLSGVYNNGIDIVGLNSGVYFIRLNDKTNQTVKRFVKE